MTVDPIQDESSAVVWRLACKSIVALLEVSGSCMARMAATAHQTKPSMDRGCRMKTEIWFAGTARPRIASVSEDSAGYSIPAPGDCGRAALVAVGDADESSDPACALRVGTSSLSLYFGRDLFRKQPSHSMTTVPAKNGFGSGVWPWDYYGVGPNISDRAKQAYIRLVDFVENDCIPAEKLYEEQISKEDRFKVVPPIIEQLKAKARSLGLWNMFMTADYSKEYGIEGPGYTTLEYAIMCEVLGQSPLAPEATNCAAPDTGNMHVIARFGTPEQRQKWLVPLLNGEIRSCFAMTEPAVASSDATNISASITKDGDYYVLNGRKWWSSGFADPRCKILVFVGKSDPGNSDRHRRQTVLLVPKDTPGIKLVRNLTVLGYDAAPHGHSEVEYTNVRVHKSNLVVGEGRGFEVLQGRLGPGE
ncbi:acyl-CoA dehydrogenase NM domain-like protein [Gonapodya prolifera JEL478]|uniref:Acyl-CoA dehydrogenase NM domain-like protein n=1 Tax=Gonapodya prolifera (strain JEL478) TaxID=1344416 RepID=A0A139ATL8_GONPJ|nr:acyl-CoA dehydrogenase NM domain-like protein [Gonapodya prolifera JEL478]|eukprot:KXS19913.1 acyl-CoA dehydrogenase NM domain-like protein [Gonapodya prolifera JEL478]